MTLDILLDPITHDLDITAFDLKTTVDDVGAIVQRLKVKLLLFKGEWFLDLNAGIPYYEQIFVSSNFKDDADTVFKLAIVNTEGITSVRSFSSTFDNTTRLFSIKFSVTITSGEVLNASLLI